MRTVTLLAGFAFALLLVLHEAYLEAAIAYGLTFPGYWIVDHVERRYRLAKDRQEREWRDGGWFDRARED